MAHVKYARTAGGFHRWSHSVAMLQRWPPTRRIGKVRRYIITIQAASFEDVDNVELPAPPQPGEPIETNLGTCIVTSTESMPAESEYAGKIICRLPWARWLLAPDGLVVFKAPRTKPTLALFGEREPDAVVPLLASAVRDRLAEDLTA
jgi:hypothetical protein